MQLLKASSSIIMTLSGIVIASNELQPSKPKYPIFFKVLGSVTSFMVDRKFQIVEEEAVVVRRIFSDYLAGKGVQAIARSLNAEGLKFDKKAWRGIHIYAILRNEKYAGNMLLQKVYTEDFRTKKLKRNKGERRQYFVEESHDPIISLELFQQVQEELKRREKKYECQHKAQEPYPFNSLIYCGFCGAKFIRKKAPTSTEVKRFPVWMCNTFDGLGRDACPAQRIHEDILIEKTREVLKLAEGIELSRQLIIGKLERIEVPAHNTLRYFLCDGRVETVTWKNPSRSKSWTPEMRRKAAEKTYARHHKNDKKEDE